MRNSILKAVMAGVCAYELAALVAETANLNHPKTISVLTARSRVLRGAMAAGYLVLGVHVGYTVKGGAAAPTRLPGPATPELVAA